MFRRLAAVAHTSSRQGVRASYGVAPFSTAVKPLVPGTTERAEAVESRGPASASSSSGPSVSHGTAPAPGHTSEAFTTRSQDPMRGINSADVFGSNPQLTACRARLIAALHPSREGRMQEQADPQAVLDAAYDFLAHGLPLPLKQIDEVSNILAKTYIDNPVSEEGIDRLTAVLAACCFSPQALRAASLMPQNARNRLRGRFLNWLLAECQLATGSPQRAEKVASAFGGQLRQYAAQGRLVLSTRLTVAWAVLRHCAGQSDAIGDIENLQLSARKRVLETARGMRLPDLQVAEEAIAAMGLPEEVKVSIPDALARLSSGRDIRKVEELWKQYLALPVDDPVHAQRDELLARFLTFVRKPREATANDLVSVAASRVEMVALGEEIMKHCPTPMPLPILHALINTEPLQGAEDAQKPDSSGKQKSGQNDRRTAVLEDAAETWKAFRQGGGVPDVKAYLLYSAKLGKYHDTTGLFSLWDEMIADKACRAVHEKEMRAAGQHTTATKAWPPTIVLNQVLSSGYLIGGPAAEMAKHLYQLSLDPSSSLDPDIITINTTLRFAAHLADIPLMNKTIAEAGRANLTPDIVTYTSLVQGLLRADRSDLARKTLDAMRTRGMEPNERMAAMLVADLAQSGSASGLRRAEDVIRDMRARGIRTTVPMWTSLIAGYFSGGWSADGDSALRRMRKHGLRLNVVGYNIVIKQALNGIDGDREKSAAAAQAAYDLFCDMLRDGEVPTWETYAMLLGGFLRSQRITRSDQAHMMAKVLDDIKLRGFTTSKSSLTRHIGAARKVVEQAGMS